MRNILLIITLLISIHSMGQRMRYKDLFPMIWTSQEERALMMLKEYLMDDPEHPNANFMLAGIYASRYLESDILTEHEKAMANAREVQVRILKCQLLVDEREVRRNNEYYVDQYGEYMDWYEIDSILTSTYESAIEFQEKAPPLYQMFTKSVLNYDKAIKAYAEICGSYNSLDNLLMLYDQDLEDYLEDLEMYYDSTLYYFNQFKTLTEEYPISYNQQLEIRPIERFRLQGLVARPDFLADQVLVWDYGAWVDNIKNTVSSQVIDLRDRLITNDKKIDEALRSEVNPDEDYKSLVDKSLVFNLEKLDYQSLPVALLNLKDYLASLRHDEGRKQYYDTEESLEVSSKYIFYSEVINDIRNADTLISVVKERNTEMKRNKHAGFVRERYGGAAGLEQFIKYQEGRNLERFEEYVLGLRNVIVDNNRESAELDSGKFLTANRIKYPLWVTGYSSTVTEGTIYTTQQRKNPDGTSYLSGLIKRGNKWQGIAYKVKSGKINWVREFDEFDQNIPGALEVTKEGVILAVNSGNQGNTLYYLNEEGKDIFAKDITVAEFPRAIKYFEDQNRFLVVFSADSVIADITSEENTRIQAYNILGDELWAKEFKMAGNFIDLIGVGEGYLYLANFTNYSGRDGRKHNVTGGFTNLLAMRIDSNGEFIRELALDSDNGYYITHVIKASDSNINLLGYKGKLNPARTGLSYGSDLVHLILDSYNNIVASNLE